jgi:hypothetical protein
MDSRLLGSSSTTPPGIPPRHPRNNLLLTSFRAPTASPKCTMASLLERIAQGRCRIASRGMPSTNCRICSCRSTSSRHQSPCTSVCGSLGRFHNSTHSVGRRKDLVPLTVRLHHRPVHLAARPPRRPLCRLRQRLGETHPRPLPHTQQHRAQSSGSERIQASSGGASGRLCRALSKHVRRFCGSSSQHAVAKPCGGTSGERSEFPQLGHGPQGDARRVFTMVRCVRQQRPTVSRLRSRTRCSAATPGTGSGRNAKAAPALCSRIERPEQGRRLLADGGGHRFTLQKAG